MEKFIIFFIVITVIPYIVLCAKIDSIGEKKGCKGYFWWAMLTTPAFAVFLVMAEPDRNKLED